MSIDNTNLHDDLEEVEKQALEEGNRRFIDYARQRRSQRSSDSDSSGSANSSGKSPQKGASKTPDAESKQGTTGADAKSKGVDVSGADAGKGVNAASEAGAEKVAKEGAAQLAEKVIAPGKKLKIIGIGVIVAIAIIFLSWLFSNLTEDVPEIMIDKPYDTGFQVDDSIGEDPYSMTETDAYYNSIRAIDLGIKIAQERAIKEFLKEVDRRGYDREETIKHSDFSALEYVTYEPLLINAVYAAMMRQEGCTLQDLCDILAENLEFRYTLSGPQTTEKTGLFEYRGVVHYKSFNAWEWRDAYDPVTGEWYRYLELVNISNTNTVKYGVAEFQPLTREDFYAAFGYNDDTMGDDYYAEPVMLSVTGWNWLDRLFDKIFEAGILSDTPHHESYFDVIVSMTETTEKYLFNTLGGHDLNTYFSPSYAQASLKPEEVAALQGYVSSLATTVDSLTIVEVEHNEIYYRNSDKMRALSTIPGQLTEETHAEMKEKAAECVAIVSTWSGGNIPNLQRMTLRDNLKVLRENALCLKLNDSQRSEMLVNTRKAIDIMLDTAVYVNESDYTAWFAGVSSSNTFSLGSSSKYHDSGPDSSCNVLPGGG